MKEKLKPVTDRWKHIGLALRLDPDELKKIEMERRDPEDCLTESLHMWLKGNYDIERFGEPSWELLDRAVAHTSGGNNPALAKEITKPQVNNISLFIFSSLPPPSLPPSLST